MQSKKHSLIETLTNVFIGYIVAFASQLAVFPIFNIHVSISDNLAIGAYFTIISIVRGYFVRRLFNNFRSNHDTATTTNQAP